MASQAHSHASELDRVILHDLQGLGAHQDLGARIQHACDLINSYAEGIRIAVTVQLNLIPALSYNDGH